MDTILEGQPPLLKQRQHAAHTSSDDKISSEKVLLDFEVTDDYGGTDVLRDERDIVTHVIPVDDDTSSSPWTCRAFVIGIGLSAFAGALAEIYYFKPQSIIISTMFLGIISYVIGIFMEAVIPRYGWFRYLNPGPFNKKENAFIVIMANSAATSAMATEVLASRVLFYKLLPKGLAPMLLLVASQLLGYGIAGLMRPILVYPSKMLYPNVLPLVSTLDALHNKRSISQFEYNQKRLKLFYIAFVGIFIWELFPEWIFPLLTGFSVFCLANPTSYDFTRVFGGSNGNEGLGLFSLCFDWQYISPAWNPFAIPLKAGFSILIGYFLGVIFFVGVYYRNIWSSKSFPFLSQELFYENGTVYDQTLILDDRWQVDPNRLAEQGLPYYAGTWVTYLLCANMAMAATFTHLLLWNRDDIRAAWTWMNKDSIKKMISEFDWRIWKEVKQVVPADVDLDPHYQEMLKYPDAPNSWYGGLLVSMILVAVVVLRMVDSMLPWWVLIVAVSLATVSILFFGAFRAITGISFIIQPFIQMIGGFLLPGKPMANMFFVLFGYNSVKQAELLLMDLKFAQYTKISPRATFTAQFIGTMVGANINFMIMGSILLHKHDILMSVEGTNIWSGQQVQQYNSQAITWGGLSHELFAHGKRYQWVTWGYVLGFFIPMPFWLVHRYYPRLRADYLYTPLIALCTGMLAAGINSGPTVYIAITLISQWYLRTRHPKWFVKYNYILGAALDGGTHAMVFVLSLAVEGAIGKEHLFPKWWGANPDGNYDRCAAIPS